MPSIKSTGARIKKNLSLKAFNKKAYLSLLFSFFIFPTVTTTLNQNNEYLMSGEKKDSINSQNLDLLSPSFIPSSEGPIGGPSDIVTDDDNALVANISPITDVESEKIFSASNKDISIYTVREGDTIGAIAEMFDVSPNTIRWANDIEVKGSIKPGQELIILPISGVKHKVAKGETIESISKKFGGDSREIRLFNGIEDGEMLVAGTELIIPDGELVSEKTSKPKTSKIGGSKETTNGYYIRPVKGVKTQGSHGRYKGIDIGARIGTPVWAMADGTVIISKSPSGWNGGYGGMIVISHSNGTQTLYAHLSRIDVKQGQKVTRGSVIGAVGNTGRSTGPHLHFEIRGGNGAAVAAKMY